MMFDRDLFLRRALGHRDFWASAIETREIHPKSVIERPAAIYADDLSDVTGVAPGIPLTARLAYMKAGQEELRATTAHRFRNLRISQGSIYNESGHVQLRKQRPRPFGKIEPIVFKAPIALACNRPSTSVYGHFAVEQMAREILAEDMGLPTVTLPSLKSFWHEEQLRASLDLHATQIESAVLEDGWIFIDRAKNRSFAERFERLRAKAGKAAATGKGSRLIYLRRGNSGAERREIQNQEAFEEGLAKMGFETLDATDPDLGKLTRALSEARVTCTIEGSQAAHHFLYAPRGSAILFLMPADRFNHVWKEICDFLDMPFSFVLGHVTTSQEYAYPLDKIEKILGRVA